MKRAAWVFVLAALIAGAAPPAAPYPPSADAQDFAALFGDRYEEAVRFVRDNPWIPDVLGLGPRESREALAVVFPEILRFSALEDMIQVRALKVLYVQYGKKYANFSVGRFQMKPVFAEQIERDAGRLLTLEERTAAGVSVFPATDTTDLRRERVLRLDDLKWQVRYLGLYMRIMDKKYRTASFADARERVRFYAAAYNGGYTNREAVIRRLMRSKSYHTELLDSKTKYVYADVALYFYDHFKQ